MEISLQKETDRIGIGPTLLIVLRRAVALAFLGFALWYWAQIVAFGNFVGKGIIAMPEHQQSASVILAVTMPVAAIGLWGLFSWGTSTWLAVMLFFLIYQWNFYDDSVTAEIEVWFHLITLAIYIGIKASMLVARKVSPRRREAAG